MARPRLTERESLRDKSAPVGRPSQPDELRVKPSRGETDRFAPQIQRILIPTFPQLLTLCILDNARPVGIRVAVVSDLPRVIGVQHHRRTEPSQPTSPTTPDAGFVQQTGNARIGRGAERGRAHHRLRRPLSEWMAGDDAVRVKAPILIGVGEIAESGGSECAALRMSLDEAQGTLPRTARVTTANDRAPSGRPARYPARTCCSISVRILEGKVVKRCAILVGPVEKLDQ